MMGKHKSIMHRWTYNGRKHLIEIFAPNPDVITFEMGYHQPIIPEDWDVKILSKVQKQLRQYLYQYLLDNGYQTDTYILSVDGATYAKGDRTFISLRMACPQLGDMEENKAFCDQITEIMHKALE